MDARQLTQFLGVVDHGGFGKAAEALHISQPSLSQTIRQLERELGVELFHRVGRGVRLSEPGRELIAPARRVVRDLEVARAAVTATKELQRGTVDIVSMPSPGIEPLTTLIRDFASRFPGMTLNVSAAFTADEVIAAVRSGTAELGLLGSAGVPYSGDLGVLWLERQPLVLISPPGTEGSRAVSRSEIAGLDLVVSPRGSLMRQLVDDLLTSGTTVRIVAEIAHRTSLLPLVLAEAGHAVMPESWRGMAESAGCLVRTIEPRSHLEVVIVHRDDLTPGATAFLERTRERYHASSTRDS